MKRPLSRSQDAVLLFLLRNRERYGAPLARLSETERWRRAKSYSVPCAFLWEVAAKVYCRPLNPLIANHARVQRANKRDPISRGAHTAGPEQAYRFEMSQRYGVFTDGREFTDAGMEHDLETLAARGLVVVDRPVLNLTRRGAEVAALLGQPSEVAA